MMMPRCSSEQDLQVYRECQGHCDDEKQTEDEGEMWVKLSKCQQCNYIQLAQH